MASSKRTLAEAADARPSKKQRALESEAVGQTEKKEKKEKKAKKEKKDEDEPVAMDVDKDEAARLKREKKEKKRAKKEQKKKLAEATAETAPEKTTAPETAAADQPTIDAFFAAQNISVTDPRGATTTPLKPILEFAHLPVTKLLARSPFAAYKTPTPIQAASWPYTLAGRDAIGIAETGSGKTMAFALPCVEALMRAPPPPPPPPHKKRSSSSSSSTVRAVVVSPTRELAMQTHEQMETLARHVGLNSVCLFGGSSKDAQRASLARGVDIIVATPGRLKDFMSDGTVDLGGAAFVVLDEADRMLDKGFEEDIKLILGSTPPRDQRQTLMFTATWPESVRALAATFMVDPVRVTIGGAGSGGGTHASASQEGELKANTRITQRVEVVEPRDKEQRLLQILKQRTQGKGSQDRILVFCLYKKEATRVELFLQQRGIQVVGIHGDLRQEQRTRSLEAFKTGATRIMVATDVAARGLDIPEVKLVVNLTFPLTIEDYVHRIGRTGRAGKTGEALTLFTVHDKAHSGTLINVLRGANQEIPNDLLKFGTTVKKKVHPVYGAFYREPEPGREAAPAKITFDD